MWELDSAAHELTQLKFLKRGLVFSTSPASDIPPLWLRCDYSDQYNRIGLSTSSFFCFS